jgi:hypothetical protein
METSRFKKIRTSKDLKLEKARLRYELVIIENNLNQNFKAVEDMASYSALFSKISYGYEVGQRIYSKINQLFSWIGSKRKGKKKRKNKEDHQ